MDVIINQDISVLGIHLVFDFMILSRKSFKM